MSRLIAIDISLAMDKAYRFMDSISSNIDWPDFLNYIKRTNQVDNTEAIVIKYRDSEGEDITISSPEEFADAMQFAKQKNMLHITLDTRRQSVAFNPIPAASSIETGEQSADDGHMSDQQSTVPDCSSNVDTTISAEDAHATDPFDTTPELDNIDNAVTIEEENAQSANSNARFFIRQKKGNRTMDVQAWGRKPGTKITLFRQKNKREGYRNQLFYYDKNTCTIRSCWNNLILEVTEYGAQVALYDRGKFSQQWVMTGPRIVNRFDESLSVVTVGPQCGPSGIKAGVFEDHDHHKWIFEIVPDPSPLPLEPTIRQTPVQCDESGEVSGGRQQDVPPAWFYNYMEKYKKEMSSSLIDSVSRNTASNVLTGLQGAVISSTTVDTPLLQPTDGSDNVTYFHNGILCNNCDQMIRGVRYKCGNCADYDLCEQCEHEDIHDIRHTFLKLRRPLLGCGRQADGTMVPLLKEVLYFDESDLQSLNSSIAVNSDTPSMEPITDSQTSASSECNITIIPEKKQTLADLAKQASQKYRPRSVKMDSEYLEDCSIPDGTHLQPGTRFIKKWLMKNNGNKQWTEETKLCMVWGNMTQMQEQVAVQPLVPGSDGIIEVEMVAPEQPGAYQSHWRLYHKGTKFGHRLWCSINVDETETLGANNGETLMDKLKMTTQNDKDEDFEEAFESLQSQTSQQETQTLSYETQQNETQTHAYETQSYDSQAGETQTPSYETQTGETQTMTQNMEQMESQTESLVQQQCVEMDTQTQSFVMSQIHTQTHIPTTQTDTQTHIPTTQTDTQTHVSTAQMDTQTHISTTQTDTQTHYITTQVSETQTGEDPEEELEIISMHFQQSDMEEKPSQTATPNNTPLVVSPPKSPIPEPILSASSSSIEIVSPTSSKDEPLSSETLQNRYTIINTSQDGEYFEDDTSFIDSDGESSGGEFIVVPLPGCFDPSKPMNLTTSIVVDRDGNEIDDFASHTTRSVSSYEAHSMTSNDTILSADNVKSEEDCSHVEQDSDPVEDVIHVEQDSDPVEDVIHVERDSHPVEEIYYVEQDSAAVESVPSVNIANASVCAAQSEASAAASSSPRNSGIFRVASQIASTAKDVFQTLQAQQQFDTSKALQSTWTPAESTWTPETNKEPIRKAPTSNSKMERLVEMGFADRSINEVMLKKHHGDVQAAIAELLSMSNTEWAKKRH